MISFDFLTYSSFILRYTLDVIKTEARGNIVKSAVDENVAYSRLLNSLHTYCFFSDGVVTKDEMKSYFLKANHRALGRDFIHNFQETTYLTPNFCEHCGGVVSDMANQMTRKKNIYCPVTAMSSFSVVGINKTRF